MHFQVSYRCKEENFLFLYNSCLIDQGLLVGFNCVSTLLGCGCSPYCPPLVHFHLLKKKELFIFFSEVTSIHI